MSDHLNDTAAAIVQEAKQDAGRLEAISAFSDRYRDACARTVKKGRMNIIEVQLGHGTALVCMSAAMLCGARSILFVAPRAVHFSYTEQLAHMGRKAGTVGGRKGRMAEACRLASDKMEREGPAEQPDILFATQWQMAEAGHWLESRPGKKPFDFIAVLDPAIARNLKSECGRGLLTAVQRAGTGIIPVDPPSVGFDTLQKLALAWREEVTRPEMPGLAERRCAATACEAMCMD